MKGIPELNFGFLDAENYKLRQNKELFNNIFVRTDELNHLLNDSINFLIGEKGTGKTAYALYLNNNYYKDTFATIKYIRETEYAKFLALKKKRHLELTDYAHIWKVIIYLLLSEYIHKKRNMLVQQFPKFKRLKKAIDNFYSDAFAPEIINAIEIVEKSKMAAEVFFSFVKTGADEERKSTFTEKKFQTNLMYIQRQFEEALRSLKLSDNYILFIDGIDIRPASIPYGDYLNCVKGLANAVWSANCDFFSSIKDSKGRLRVVLLIRPDIFNSLGLQNQNNKIRDNSVFLDWKTTYPEYRTSNIFVVADRLLASQQHESLDIGVAWDYYFPYKHPTTSKSRKEDDSFLSFLRFSYYRPRDIIAMLGILRGNFIQQRRDPKDNFRLDDFRHHDFRNKLSDYLMGEIRDQLHFYHSKEVYELFLRFFVYLNGKAKFDYDEYLGAFNQVTKYATSTLEEMPKFFESADGFLQFLYELNVLCYVEVTENYQQFIRWCFRERTPSNISPKVKTHQEYWIHYGIGKALNVGEEFI